MSARALGVVALAALAALQLAWHGWLAPPQQWPRALVLALAAGPLLGALAYCARRRERGLLIGATFGLFYFCHGVMEAWTEPAVRALALTEAALVVLLTGAIGWAAIAEKRARRAAAAVAASADNR